MEVGIIGNGRFGSLMAKILREKGNYKVKIYSSKAIPDGKIFFELKATCDSDIVIPCVPISAFEDTIKKISPVLRPTSLVVDVCSVKVHPSKIMKDFLSEDIDILATHPMFGPDSTKDGTFFEKLKFVHSALRIKNKVRLNNFLNLWKGLGCEMIEMTPDEHDKQAAYTHAFAFLVGKIGIMLNIKENKITTRGFECLLYNQQAVENDTGELFRDMQIYNPYTKEMRKNFKDSIGSIESTLN